MISGELDTKTRLVKHEASYPCLMYYSAGAVGHEPVALFSTTSLAVYVVYPATPSLVGSLVSSEVAYRDCWRPVPYGQPIILCNQPPK